MRWDKRKIAYALAAILFVLYAGSLALPAVYEACSPSDAHGVKDCPQYNLGQIIPVVTVEWSDRHYEIISAVAGIFVAAFTFILIGIGRRADKHFRVSERAYVKMSHITPPRDYALNWTRGGTGWFSVSVQIKNFGQTPARVTDVMLTHRILLEDEVMPRPIPYRDTSDTIRETGAYLVRDDAFMRIAGYEISNDQRQIVDAGDAILLFYGYVDYIDQFGQRHRAGYGRQYTPDDTLNNLVFPKVPGLNYDRLRRADEGTDWDET